MSDENGMTDPSCTYVGDCRVFEAIADRVLAGEPVPQVLADYGLQWVVPAAAPREWTDRNELFRQWLY